MEHDNSHHDHDGITEDREQRPPVYFNILFYGLIIWGVAFMAFYLLSGWSSDAEFQQKMTAHKEQHQQESTAPEQPAPKAEQSQVAATTPAAPDAAALFSERCAMCHGADATGGIGPNLTAAEYIYGKTPEEVKTSIADGRPKGMPSFASQLSQEELQSLVDYLISL